MPPLGPGISIDGVTESVAQWLRDSHSLTVHSRYTLDLSEAMPAVWKPAVIGVTLVAGTPGHPPDWVIEAVGDLNNAPHYQVHFSGALYTLLTRTRPDDRTKERRLALALPFHPEGKVPSPYRPVLKRLHGTRFLDAGLELLLVAPNSQVTHQAGDDLERFLANLE